jgi:hypothetical protein
VAVDHAGGEDEAICRVLEAMWQRPDEAVQLNAQSLIGRGQGLADWLKQQARVWTARGRVLTLTLLCCCCYCYYRFHGD